MKKIHLLAGIVIMGTVLSGSSGTLWAQDAPSKSIDQNASHWYLSLGGGGIDYEGDEAVQSGLYPLLRLGYDYTPRWTFRGEISYFPELKANMVYNYESGTAVPRPGLHGDSTWAMGIAGDVLFHCIATDDRQWDPYLVGGLGLLYYDKQREWRNRVDIPVRVGAGLAYHFTPEWAVNVDLMGQLTIDHSEFNFIPSMALSWRPAGRKPVRPTAPALLAPDARTTDPIPSPPSDDLRTFVLVMNFTEDQWQISPEYFSELDAIARIIQTFPASEIWIEGHIEQQPNLSKKKARKITEKRAQAIRDYFVGKQRIVKKRFTATGYGFSRPKTPADPGKGGPENQRMLIRIRPPQIAP